MQLETLYKRAKTGKIQYWKIRVVHGIGNAHIVKESGQLGTDNPLIHEEPVTEGKNKGRSNATSPGQQAELDAQSDWRKKKDEGYKSLKDLNLLIVGPTDEAIKSDPNNMAIKEYFMRLEAALNDKLPRFNTDASGNVKPMLATDWQKIKKIDYPVLVQPKLDGVRCLMIVECVGPAYQVTFLSRSGKPYSTLNHIGTDIQKAAKESRMGDFILDGEIYSEELTFQEITQAVKKQYPNTLKLHFRAYDVVNEDPQNERLEYVRALVEAIGSEHIKYVPTFVSTDEESVRKLHDSFVEQGFEGAMIRLEQGKYEQGCRSRSLLKVKEFDESEFRAKYFYRGQREEDLLVMCETKDGLEFTAKMIGTREHKAALVAEHGIEQRLKDSMTIKHFGWTTDGLPRFPIGKGLRSGE